MEVARELNFPLLEASAALRLYDRVAELLHGPGARFPIETQERVEATADKLRAMVDFAGQRSSILGAIVSALFPANLAVAGVHQGCDCAVVPDALSDQSKNRRLLFAVFFSQPLDLQLEIEPEDAYFQRARAYTGAQDIQSGHPELDARAVVRGSDEARIRQFLQNPDVQTSLLQLTTPSEGRWRVTDRGAAIAVVASSLRDGSASQYLTALTALARAQAAA